MKEKEKRNKKMGIILFFVMGIITGSVSKFIFDLDWSYAIGLALLIIVIGLIGIFKKENKEKKEKEEKTKEFVKSLETSRLSKTIEEKEEFTKIARKEYSNRKDKSIKEVISDEFMGIINYGMVVLILGLFMLGAIPSYFNVNDELLNPINESMGINNSLEIVKNTGYESLVVFHNVGVNHPNLFFWLFWITIFMWLIYPIIKIIIHMFRKYKGGRTRWT